MALTETRATNVGAGRPNSGAEHRVPCLSDVLVTIDYAPTPSLIRLTTTSTAHVYWTRTGSRHNEEVQLTAVFDLISL